MNLFPYWVLMFSVQLQRVRLLYSPSPVPGFFAEKSEN